MTDSHDNHTSGKEYKGSSNPFVAWVNADPTPDDAPWSEENVKKFREAPVYVSEKRRSSMKRRGCVALTRSINLSP